MTWHTVAIVALAAGGGTLVVVGAAVEIAAYRKYRKLRRGKPHNS